MSTKLVIDTAALEKFVSCDSMLGSQSLSLSIISAEVILFRAMLLPALDSLYCTAVLSVWAYCCQI